jgi:hypothetical protein
MSLCCGTTQIVMSMSARTSQEAVSNRTFAPKHESEFR